MSIKRNEVYGDFKVVERLNAERQLFRCECVRCGKSKRYLADSLSEEPLHVCSENFNEINSIRKDLAARIADDVGEDDDEIIKSIFADDAAVIQELLAELDEQESDSARKFQLTSLKMLVDLIPLAEKQFRREPRQSNSYALNALLSQVRELVTDLQAKEDSNDLVERVLNQIIQPAFLQVGQVLIDNLYALRREIEVYVEPGKNERFVQAFDSTIKTMASGYQALFYDVRTRIGQELE